MMLTCIGEKFDFLESLMREEFPENQERVIVRLINEYLDKTYQNIMGQSLNNI